MPELSDSELAQQYGFAMAVLNSDPELSSLFHRAVSETWTPERFQAQLRATQWYQTHNEQWRNASVLKASDPASYATNVQQTQTRMGMLAAEMGANVGSQLPAMAEQAYTLGWDDNQIRQVLSTYITHTDGRVLGQAGQWVDEWRKYAADMGITLNDDWYTRTASWVAGGRAAPDDAKTQIRQMAISAYPNLADRLQAGQTLADIAEPYRQSMGSLLEMDPNTITLQDPAIKSALSSRDSKGNVVTKTLWEFENDTRNDPRWLKTQNAQNAAMSVTKRVLGDMGLVS